MKKIINGRLYSTNTAKKIAKYDNQQYGSYNYFEETLYKKKTGEYFLYCFGEANTKYRVCCSHNQFCGGSEIIPLSLSEAEQWAENYMDADDYIGEFGEVAE